MVASESYLVAGAFICAQRNNGGPVKYWVKVADLSIGLMLDIPIEAEQIERVTSDIEFETFANHPALESATFFADVSLDARDYGAYMEAANALPMECDDDEW